MLINKLKAGAETSKLLAAASTPSTVSVLRNERPKGRGRKPTEAAGSTDKLTKDTVASLLAKSREQLSFPSHLVSMLQNLLLRYRHSCSCFAKLSTASGSKLVRLSLSVTSTLTLIFVGKTSSDSAQLGSIFANQC